jgi:hypothetical protein
MLEFSGHVHDISMKHREIDVIFFVNVLILGDVK